MDIKTNNEQVLKQLALQLGAQLKSQQKTLAVAESCTGGWLAKILTDIAGSSAWFQASVVSYSNLSKQQFLAVEEATLNQFGAVSEQIVLQMCEGLLAKTTVDVVVSISGIAGPGGGTKDKPVGLVWLSWGLCDKKLLKKCYHFTGNRESVRRQAVHQAIVCLLDLLASD